jgi:hypothetical protein
MAQALFTGLSADASNPPQDGKGMVFRAVYPFNRAAGPLLQSIIRHDGVLTNDLQPLKELMGLPTPYVRAEFNGEYYQYIGNNRRYAGFYKPDGDKPEDTAIIIEEILFNDGTWRLDSIKLVSNIQFALVAELPCCEGELSVLTRFKFIPNQASDGNSTQEPQWTWTLKQSPKALVEGVLEDYKKRQVEVGYAVDDSDKLIIRERLKHLLGLPCDCPPGAGFGAAYREPSKP